MNNQIELIPNRESFFPIQFYSFSIPKDFALSIYEEVRYNEEMISRKSEVTTFDHSKEYHTDYNFPTSIGGFERLLGGISEYFHKEGIVMKIDQYWTAIYGKNGEHGVHGHMSSIYGKSNFSGILYLSDFGVTDFFSPHPCSETMVESVKSEFGRVIMFPSYILHTVPNHGIDKKRYVIAFNAELNINDEPI